jgi:tetratricopeptide (TPR) repeat protein
MALRLLRPSHVAVVVVACHVLTASPTVADTDAQDRLAALVADLGNDDYLRREAAAAKLKALGPTAIDALLEAGESSGDIEIALRARWLVETIPFELPHDPPEVVKLLARFKQRSFGERVRAMHRLLRVDDDAGIEPLARVARLDASTAGSRIAAALLAREWRVDDPSWPDIRRRISAGLGPSTRPAARFLSALVAFTGESGSAERDAALAAATTTLDDLRRPAPDGVSLAFRGEGPEESQVIFSHTGQIFARCHAQMLAAAGRRDDAVAAARALVAADLASGDETNAEVVHTLMWAVDVGLPDAVDAALAVPGLADGNPLVGCAIALAERARGREAQAAERISAAFAAAARTEVTDRLEAARLLAKWGSDDWAIDLYDRILAEPGLGVPEAATTSMMYSELLHDLERDEEAARCLRRVFGDEGGNEGRREGGLGQDLLGRDLRSIRSRMHFFEACALLHKGDKAGSRTALDRALGVYPKDVDALIALYSLPDNTVEQRADAVRKVKAALGHLEEEINAVPDEASGYNEYAWLVANTEGDVGKATRFSKVSLLRSFDNASFLDTLAHCHAAAGRHAAAIRTQRLAKRYEPHNRTIQRNLERFEKLASP